MKILGKVRCQYWRRPEPIEIEMPDDATEEQIEEALREASLEAAGLEYWIDGAEATGTPR